MFLWACIIAYMAALPHLIIVFNFILGSIPLPVIKALPAISLVLGGLAYLGLSRMRGKGYGLGTFILPALILIAGVFVLEQNPIKHIHIPLYALLVGLIYLALRREGARFPVLLAAFIYASILGVFDEVHHGLHPERYFGWKDMVINAAGAGIGGLFIARLDNIRPHRLFILNVVDKVFWASFIIILLSAIITTLSVINLFDVAQISGGQNGLSAGYPLGLLIANAASISICLVLVFTCLFKFKTSFETELFLFFPALIFMSIQMLIVLAYAKNIVFQ